MRKSLLTFGLAASTLATLAVPLGGANADAGHPRVRKIQPTALPQIGQVAERYQSYNVESVEVTGGNFWAPYPKAGEAPPKPAVGPHGTEFATDAYQKREPIDLRNRRLRVLAKGLAPSYMRVSGSWANAIHFQDDDAAPRPAPAGYQGVLTRKQWAGVIEFGKAVDARVLTSFAVSDGARSKDGAWNPEGARRLFDFTRSIGGRIDAVELMNEPNVRPKPYAPADFARDHRALRTLLRDVSPSTLLVGPGSTGEAGFKLFANLPEQMSTMRLLSAMEPSTFDVFSHHFYGAVSERCKSLGERRGTDVTTSEADALTESWLARADQAQSFYRNVREKVAPGAPIWITEMAQTACGGDRWSSTFVDTFRYVDQLGRLAKQDVSIVFHNTLAASDYALIDDRTWLPRPNYWAALLWRRTMGTKVLDAGTNQGTLHVYAHCQRGVSGGVTVVAINLDQGVPAALELGGPVRRFTLTAAGDANEAAALNGRRLALVGGKALPRLVPVMERRGLINLPPASISFMEMPRAGNTGCQ
ncbi:hypothetical protein [Novosphingobium aquae]|uniref:Glycosyl hydrolase family 79 n=1 Tax=Novosphingobium aquae TaxID=3133435 RepID=A0ABU8S863_9SPHN